MPAQGSGSLAHVRSILALLFGRPDRRFFLREIDQRLRVSSDMHFAIQKAFAEAGIQIPYPQRDLHFRNAPPSPDRDPQGEIC